jgi:translation initiation factor 1 (eIF-1/SUI1)
MDLFLIDQNNNNSIFNDNKVVVFCEKNGRNYNTYIVGLDETDEQNMLKTLKNKFGCGGTIKKINYEGKEDTKVIHIQGNFVLKTGDFLKKLNIKNLIVKELVQ